MPKKTPGRNLGFYIAGAKTPNDTVTVESSEAKGPAVADLFAN